MSKIDARAQINEDLMIVPGTGATMSVGSDAYAYWVTEVLPNHIYGIGCARSHFGDSYPWEGGYMAVEPFDPAKDKTEFFIKRCYGKWWKVTNDGHRLERFSSKWRRFRLGHACSYRDPSF